MFFTKFSSRASYAQFICYKKIVFQKFYESEIKVMLYISQSAIFNPFSIPLPAASHIDLLGVKPEKRVNLSNSFIISITDNSSFKKKVAESKKYDYTYLILLYFCFLYM